MIKKVSYEKLYSSTYIIFMNSVTKQRTRCRNTSQKKNPYVTKLRHQLLQFIFFGVHNLGNFSKLMVQ